MFWKKKIENNWNKKKISLCLFLFWENRKWFNFLFLTFQPNTFFFWTSLLYYKCIFAIHSISKYFVKWSKWSIYVPSITYCLPSMAPKSLAHTTFLHTPRTMSRAYLLQKIRFLKKQQTCHFYEERK